MPLKYPRDTAEDELDPGSRSIPRAAVAVNNRAGAGSPPYEPSITVFADNAMGSAIGIDGAPDSVPRATHSPEKFAMLINESVVMKWAFDKSSDGMLVTDLEGYIIRVNDAFCKLFNYPQEEVVGRRTGFLKSKYSTPEFYQHMWRSLREQGKWKGEIVNRTKDGREIPCFLTITPIITDLGERIGFLGVEIDLTDRKRLEEQVMQGEKLASIGEAVATLAHEIRNPLNGIRMNLYMLREARRKGEAWCEEDDESLEMLSAETARLQEMVNTVLSYARKPELAYDRVMVEDLMDEILHVVHFDADEAGVTLLNEAAGHQTLRCDSNLLKQVLMNLIRNGVEAARESAEKIVRVRVFQSVLEGDGAVSPSGQALIIDVDNSGAAIPPDIQHKLFNPFFTTKEKGLGLGLAASLKIVRHHHGTLSLISPLEPQAAPFVTRFRVALPV